MMRDFSVKWYPPVPKKPIQGTSGVDVIAAELAELSQEVTAMTRNFPITDAEAMKSGEPREGAGELEKLIRVKYRRMNELESALNAAH